MLPGLPYYHVWNSYESNIVSLYSDVSYQGSSEKFCDDLFARKFDDVEFSVRVISFLNGEIREMKLVRYVITHEKPKFIIYLLEKNVLRK